MEDEIKYMRIGTSLYKVVKKPNIKGATSKEIVPWSYGALRQDESKEYIFSIPKYDGFCIVPDNINYKRVVGTFYNKYEPIIHVPTEGSRSSMSWEWIICSCFTRVHYRSFQFLCWYRRSATPASQLSSTS